MKSSLLKQAFDYYDSNLCGKSFCITFYGDGHIVQSIVVKFSAKDFKHLFGFQYLKDIAVSKIKAKSLYYSIQKGSITQDDIEKSSFYNVAEERLTNYQRVLEIIQKGKVVYSGPQSFLGINAEYLMYIFDAGILYHLFYAKMSVEYCPCSFFPRNNSDYVTGHRMYSIVSCVEC